MRDLTTSRRLPKVTESAAVRRLPACSRFILRGGEEAMAGAGGALGLSISQQACRATMHGELAALWLGPDEQLLLAPASSGTEISAVLENALRDVPHSLVDVSHRQTTMEISGPHARMLLNAGCPLDLDVEAFPVGMCTRTMLAKAEIVLWRCQEEVFRVEVWRSFAAYASLLLSEAARDAESIQKQ